MFKKCVKWLPSSFEKRKKKVLNNNHNSITKRFEKGFRKQLWKQIFCLKTNWREVFLCLKNVLRGCPLVLKREKKKGFWENGGQKITLFS